MNNTHSSRPSRIAAIDSSRDILRRVPGCLGGFIGLILLLTVSDYLRPFVPSLALQLAAILLGVALIHGYGAVARRRWHVAAPDAIGLLKRDFSAVYDRHAEDLRLAFTPDAPFFDRALHELLYALKWVGHLLVYAGLGSLLVSGMRQLGILEFVARLGP